MTKEMLIKELENLKKYTDKMEEEEWSQYAAGIMFAVGWLQAWMDTPEKIKELINL